MRASWIRWIGWFALASVFAIACWGLSQWQLARLAEVRSNIAQLSANYDAAPVPLEDVGQVFQEYRAITTEGKYLPSKMLLVRNRVLDGQVGFEQWAVFETQSGRLLLVDRGWIPTGQAQNYPDSVPAVPSFDLSLVARFKSSVDLEGREAPPGQLAAPDVYAAVRLLSLPQNLTETAGYFVLASENPSTSTPTLLPRPVISEGNHLSYAFQWVLFALMAFAALAWAVRKELMERRRIGANRDLRHHSKKRSDLDAEYEDLNS